MTEQAGANVVSFDVARAERFITDYYSGAATREETKAKLMSAFGFEDGGAELVMKELDDAWQ